MFMTHTLRASERRNDFAVFVCVSTDSGDIHAAGAGLQIQSLQPCDPDSFLTPSSRGDVRSHQVRRSTAPPPV